MATKPLYKVVITTKSGGEFTVQDTATSNDGSAVWGLIRSGHDLLYKDGEDWQYIAHDCICSAKATVTPTEVEDPTDDFCQPIEDPCASDEGGDEPTP